MAVKGGPEAFKLQIVPHIDIVRIYFIIIDALFAAAIFMIIKF